MVYINIGGSLKVTSVYRKIIGQIEGMNNCGISCRGVFLTTHVKELKPLNSFIDFHPIPVPTGNLFYQLKLKKSYLKAIEKILEETDADYVYLRYSFGNRQLLKIIRESKKRFIIERNSKILNEIIAICKTQGLKLKIAAILSKIQDCIIPFLAEKFYAKPISNNTALTVGVTQELTLHYQNNPNKRITLPNGIDAERYKVRKANPYHHAQKCVFLILDGTSTPTPWQGVDRLIRSVIAHKLSEQIEIHIAGNKKLKHPHTFVKYLDYLEGEELENAINNAHIGTGNLCLFRKNLFEGSVLKNREYIARGLPVLYAMDDLDFDTTEIAQYAHKIPNSNEIIDLPRLLDWLAGLYKDNPHLSENMHSVASKVLGFNAKMKKLKDALDGI